MKLICGFIGKAKDFRPIFAKKEDLPVTAEKAKLNNFDIYILPQEAERCK